MKRLNAAELIPGMIVAENVYTYNDQLIFPKGLILTDKAITRLEFYAITAIKVEDDYATLEPPHTDNLSYSEKLRQKPEFQEFKKEFNAATDFFKLAINDIVEKNSPIDDAALIKNIINLLQTCSSMGNALNVLHNMREYDDLTYAHSMNVALICNVFAGWLGYSEEEANLVTLCGLFHDIGKLMIPDTIIKKPDKLTMQEFEVIKTHTTEGFRILRNSHLNEHVKNAALMHHEKCDGSGYPFGFKSDKIDPYAKIVGIADVYDAMTSARIYRGPMCPFKVIDLFEYEGLQKYDPQVFLTFLENVSNTYLLNRVRLNNGEEGTVIFINKHKLSRPVIKCMKYCIDLSKEPDLYIEEFV